MVRPGSREHTQKSEIMSYGFPARHPDKDISLDDMSGHEQLRYGSAAYSNGSAIVVTAFSWWAVDNLDAISCILLHIVSNKGYQTVLACALRDRCESAIVVNCEFSASSLSSS